MKFEGPQLVTRDFCLRVERHGPWALTSTRPIHNSNWIPIQFHVCKWVVGVGKSICRQKVLSNTMKSLSLFQNGERNEEGLCFSCVFPWEMMVPWSGFNLLDMFRVALCDRRRPRALQPRTSMTLACSGGARLSIVRCLLVNHFFTSSVPKKSGDVSMH